MIYRIALVIGIIALVFIVASCQRKPMPISKLSSPLMTLSKSKCYGKCKVYQVKIYADNSISYEGIKFVDKIGLFQSTLDDGELKSLVSMFTEIDFENLDSSYLTPSSDPQKITLGYNEKEVIYQNRAASEALKSITESIDLIVQKTTWEVK